MSSLTPARAISITGSSHFEPIGYISTHGAYYSPSPNINAKDELSERAILLLTDDPFEHSRILADKLALGLDCDVWVPNYLQGSSMCTYTDPYLLCVAGYKPSAWNWIKVQLRKIPLLIKNRRSAIDLRLARLIKALQEEKNYSKIGVVGRRSGGSIAIRLASTGWIKSIIVYHPRKFTLPEVEAIKIPSAWVFAEEDRFFKKSLRRKVQTTLCQSSFETVEHEFWMYKGTSQGFACPDLAVTGPKAFEAYETAFEHAVRWFSNTLAV